MEKNSRKPLVGISDGAIEIYQMMLNHMDENGFMDFEGCLEISAYGASLEGGVPQLGEYLTELQSASMVFPHLEQSGWVVRFPIVRF